MKKTIMLLLLIIGAVTAYAREPYGDYICRYIVDGGKYHAINNPVKITHYGFQVKNTNAGTKTWQANYQGTFSYVYGRYGNEKARMHNFYLTNQRVEFSISDEPLIPYNGRKYYLINFDGQWQLAEADY